MVMTWRRAAIVLVLGGAVVLALVADRAIVTERERIDATIEGLRASLSTGRVEAVFRYISREYDDEELSREGLRGVVLTAFERYGPIHARVTESWLKRAGDVAGATLVVFAESQRTEFSGYSEWSLTLRKEEDGMWRVTRAKPVRIGRKDVSGWGEVMRGAWRRF